MCSQFRPMAIRFLRHKQINKQRWDALINHSPQGQVYALSWYLDIVSPDWGALIAITENGAYKTVMPLPYHQKLQLNYVQQPLFSQQLGLFSEEEEIPDAVCHSFLQEVKKRFRLVNHYQFNTDNKLPEGEQQGSTFTLYLNLNRPYAEIAEGYTRDRRMNLKRAHKAGLQLEECEDLEPLVSFFRSETAHRIYGGVADEAYDMLRRLYAALKERGLARLFYSIDEQGRKNAGCLFMIWRNKVVYIFNASAAHGRRLNGRSLMLDHIFQQYAEQDYIFDFESPDNREPEILQFYKSFGPQEMPIPVLEYNNLPKALKFVRALRMKVVKRLKSKG